MTAGTPASPVVVPGTFRHKGVLTKVCRIGQEEEQRINNILGANTEVWHASISSGFNPTICCGLDSLIVVVGQNSVNVKRVVCIELDKKHNATFTELVSCKLNVISNDDDVALHKDRNAAYYWR